MFEPGNIKGRLRDIESIGIVFLRYDLDPIDTLQYQQVLGKPMGAALRLRLAQMMFALAKVPCDTYFRSSSLKVKVSSTEAMA